MSKRSLLENILAGKTALGRELPGDQAMPFTNQVHVRMAVTAALALASEMFGSAFGDDDDSFTRFARKMILYVRRAGVAQSHPSFLTRAGLAANAACLRPDLLHTNIGFAALVDMAEGQEPARDRQKPHRMTREEQVAMMARKAGAPPLVPVWRSMSAGFTLYELTHPFHVWREGVLTGNCLSRIIPYSASSHVRAEEPAAFLQDLGYWRLIEKKMCRLYSLRRGAMIAAVLGVYGGELREMTVHIQPDEVFVSIVSGVIAEFERLMPGFSIEPYRWSDVSKSLMTHAMALRGAPLPSLGRRNRRTP